jgi:hypothetical protein
MEIGLHFGLSDNEFMQMKRILIVGLFCLIVVSCSSQQTKLIAPTNATAIYTSSKGVLYPTRTPVITATPILNIEMENIASVIGNYYKTSRCVVNLANPSLDEWLSQPADKPELTDFTNQLDFNSITVEEIADSANQSYRAYIVVEPNPSCGENCFQSRVYVEDRSTNQIFRVDWGGYMSWRFIYGATWFGDSVLTFEQSLNPDRVEIVGVDMKTKDYVFHVAYTPKEKCPVETPNE